jgi:hypothetical protein
MVVDKIQVPDAGVKVYTVVPALAVLITEGDHVPVIPFVDVVESIPGVVPIQYGPSCVNVGVTLAFTTTVMVAVVAHCPAFGVKVYTVDPALAVLIVAGDHVPEMPFADVVASVAGVAPAQYGPC